MTIFDLFTPGILIIELPTIRAAVDAVASKMDKEASEPYDDNMVHLLSGRLEGSVL